MQIINLLKKVRVNVSYHDKEYTKGYNLTIPSPQGKGSSLKRGVSPSKGVVSDREIFKVLNEMDAELKSDGD